MPSAGSTGQQLLLWLINQQLYHFWSKFECTAGAISGKGSEESHARLSPHSLVRQKWSVKQQVILVWNLDTADPFARSASKFGICLTASASQGDVMKLNASDAVWYQVKPRTL